MMAHSAASLVVLALGCLALNLYAFRSDAAAAGHGRAQMVKMAAVWLTIILALTLLVRTFAS